MKNLKVFETSILDRPMEIRSFIADYISPEFDSAPYDEKVEEIQYLKTEFLENCAYVGEKYGFDGEKIIIPYGSKTYNEKGNYFIADDTIYDKKENLLNVRLKKDIVLLRENNPGITIGFPVSDDIVLIAEDQENKVAALAHCGIEQLSGKIPVYMINIFKDIVGSDIENIKFYISSNLKEDNNTFLLRPKSIKQNEKLWRKCCKRNFSFKEIKKNFTKVLCYHINQEKCLVNMLLNEGVLMENIIISDRDTYSSRSLFSDKFSKDRNVPELKGKFLVGAYYGDYTEENEVNIRTRSL